MNGQPYNNITSIEDHRNSIGLHTKNKKSYNGNGGGGDNMEERIIKLEADVGSIKEIVKDHNNRFDKIDARLESSEKLINIKLDNLLDNLKENYISYKGLFGMLAVFTAVIGFLIKYFH